MDPPLDSMSGKTYPRYEFYHLLQGEDAEPVLDFFREFGAASTIAKLRDEWEGTIEPRDMDNPPYGTSDDVYIEDDWHL